MFEVNFQIWNVIRKFNYLVWIFRLKLLPCLLMIGFLISAEADETEQSAIGFNLKSIISTNNYQNLGTLARTFGLRIDFPKQNVAVWFILHLILLLICSLKSWFSCIMRSLGLKSTLRNERGFSLWNILSKIWLVCLPYHYKD